MLFPFLSAYLDGCTGDVEDAQLTKVSTCTQSSCLNRIAEVKEYHGLQSVDIAVISKRERTEGQNNSFV